MKNTNKIYLLVCILVVFGISKITFLNQRFVGNTNDYILMFFWILLCFLSLIILKYPKDNALYKKNADRMVVISLMVTLLVSYLLGFFVGFGKNGYYASPNFLIRSLAIVSFIKISKEVIRYVVAKNSFLNKKPIIILTIMYIIFEIAIAYRKPIDPEHWFYFISITVLPCIASELLCSYLVYNFGLETSLLYILPYSLYTYLLPYLPSLGDYVNSVIFIILPFMIYFLTIKIVRYQNKEKVSLNQKTKNLFIIPLVAFLSVLVVLVSGVMRYRLIAIASDSMNPVFYRGDGVIYKNIRFVDKVEVGDIIAFNNSGRIVTHRVLAIINEPDRTVYKTKGDNNQIQDDFDVDSSDTIGVIQYVVKYVGYPTLWFNENIRRIIR